MNIVQVMSTKMTESPSTLNNMDLHTLQKILGVYCSETRTKTDNLSQKRKFINELYEIMTHRGETIIQIRKWLSDITYRCDGLEAVMNEYSSQHFETFQYENKVFDVRNIIEAIEEKSRSLWYSSKNEEIDITTLKKEVYGEPEPVPHVLFPRCAEVMMQFFNEMKNLPKTVKEDIEEHVDNYRTTHDFDSLLVWGTRKLNIWQKNNERTQIPYLQNYTRYLGLPEFDIQIKSPDGKTEWTRAVWCIYSEVQERGFTGLFTVDVLAQMELWLSQHRYPMCAEVLMQLFEKFDLHIVWNGERSRQFKEYMENNDSVTLLTYCATFINEWAKYGARAFKDGSSIPYIGPKEFPIKIMSPDGNTDWTRMVSMIGEFAQYIAKFTPEYLLQLEDFLKKKTDTPLHVKKRHYKWQQKKTGTTTVKTIKDVIPTNDLLRNVRRKLDENEVKHAVSLKVWIQKLDTFCSHFEKILPRILKGRTSGYYEQIMDLFHELQGNVHHVTPNTQRISEIIQDISDKEDKEAQNNIFKHHSASQFKIENKWENIMDVLAHLPEELQEMSAPSRARSPSRSPVPSFSPVAPPSPRARSGGGVGGNRRDIKMSELLNALEALM